MTYAWCFWLLSLAHKYTFLSVEGMSMTEYAWILGFVFAGIMIWIGLSKSVGNLRPSSRQVVAAAGFLLLLVMIIFSLDKAFGLWAKFPRIVVGILGVLIVLDRFVRIAVLPGRGGNMIVDLGRIGGAEVIVNIVVALALAWYVLKDIGDIVQMPGWKLENISYQVFGLSIALAVLVQGVSKRRVLQGGIFLGTSFLAWSKIERFDWEKESGTAATLVLFKRTPIPFFTSTSVSVRLDQMKQLEDIMEQHNITRKAEAPKLDL
jgi:hypothetical protein